MDMIKFFLEIGKLKRIKRKGWLLRGIKEPESIAEHSFRVALMALILCEKRNLDLNKLVKMALIHDIAEVKTGDITPYDDVSKQEKIEKERNAMNELLSSLGPEQRKEYVSIWKEFEIGKTKEAQILKEIDKLEMALQALEYELEESKNLHEFFEDAKQSIKDQELIRLLKKIELIRRK
jgi:5'-deoxynucleotidase YfbR-like HD superfamily hydrolase